MSKKKKVAKNMKDSSFNLDPVVDENVSVNEDVSPMVDDAVEDAVKESVELSEEPKKKKKYILWLLLAVLICIGGFFGYKYWLANRPIQPTTTLKEKEITITAGDTYNPESNIKVGEGDTYQITTDLNTTKAGEYKVTIQVFSPTGVSKELTYKVLVNVPKSSSGCELVYVKDKDAWEEQVWKIDKPGQPAQYKQEWVVDVPGHYEKKKVIDVPYQKEQGHYETIIITPAVEEVGHWETIHHPAQTHQVEIREDVLYVVFCTPGDAETITVKRSLIGNLAEYCKQLFLQQGWDCARWYTKWVNEVVGYETVVDQEAWDEQKWVVDVAGKPAVTEQKYVKDKDEVQEVSHYEDVWVEDKGHYEQKLVKEAIPEQGHYETVTHPEVGHYEERKGC